MQPLFDHGIDVADVVVAGVTFERGERIVVQGDCSDLHADVKIATTKQLFVRFVGSGEFAWIHPSRARKVTP